MFQKGTSESPASWLAKAILSLGDLKGVQYALVHTELPNDFREGVVDSLVDYMEDNFQIDQTIMKKYDSARASLVG